MRIRIPLIGSIVVLSTFAPAIAMAQNDWPAYGRDPGAQRYSPLTQIGPANVGQLVPGLEIRDETAFFGSQSPGSQTPRRSW